MTEDSSKGGTMEHTQAVLKEIESERWRQKQQWGDFHDDHHSADDWRSIIIGYLDWRPGGHKNPLVREDMIKAITVGVAAIEAMDRMHLDCPARPAPGGEHEA